MFEDFNMAAGIAEDTPVWSSGPYPAWGRTSVYDDDEDNASAGTIISDALENYAAVMEGLQDLREGWPGFEAEADALAEAEENAARARDLKARADEARRVIFDREISEASILQQSLRISRPLTFRNRPRM